jgi:hypothetical protein
MGKKIGATRSLRTNFLMERMQNINEVINSSFLPFNVLFIVITNKYPRFIVCP